MTRESLAKLFTAIRSDIAPESAAAAPDASFAGVSGTPLLGGIDFVRSSLSFENNFTLAQPLAALARESFALAEPVSRLSSLDPSAVAAVADDVREQSPLPGVTLDRSLSVSERLSIPPASQAQDFALSNQLQILTGLDELGLVVDDLVVPLYTINDNNQKVREDKIYLQVKNGLAATILGQPRVADADEANILGHAVALQENASIFLRRLEGRVQLYKSALKRCQEAAAQIRVLLASARQRLAEIDRQLAEARHDVTVALALLEEETQRIEGINNRRLDTLTHHVPFLAYHRPRVVVTLAETPVRSLDPGLFDDPVPAALARPVDAPPELREMVDLLREAPLRWFRRLPPLLDKIDRLDVLQTTIRLAKSRAEVTVARPLLAATPAKSSSPAAEGTSKALAAQRQKMAQSRTQTARLDLSAVEQQSWKGAAEMAKKVLSLGDLLDIPHGRAEVARLGARELDEILRVATALWAEFGEVLPALRLDWVERLSQFDAPFDLRRLSNLPRWEEIEVLDRRALQALADWLFQRVDPRETEAVELISDLVRVCLLLASHAPVDRIVAGQVAEDTPVRPGGTVPLVVDLSRVRIGMHVILYSQEKTVARGIVEDLGGGRATARVLESYAGQTSVAKNARVEFTEAVWKVAK